MISLILVTYMHATRCQLDSGEVYEKSVGHTHDDKEKFPMQKEVGLRLADHRLLDCEIPSLHYLLYNNRINLQSTSPVLYAVIASYCIYWTDSMPESA